MTKPDILKFKHYPGKVGSGTDVRGSMDISLTDIGILTIYTAQVAAAQKDRSRPIAAAEWRFFSMMGAI
jgi:hypothetical protein